MTHILVIEDEPALARALAITLRAHGYQSSVAVTGTAGLELVGKAHPDLVLLDLGLPDLDGVTIIRAVRGWSQVPIVVLSASARTEDHQAGLQAGADAYLNKPIDFAALADVIGRVPGGREAVAGMSSASAQSVAA